MIGLKLCKKLRVPCNFYKCSAVLVKLDTISLYFLLLDYFESYINSDKNVPFFGEHCCFGFRHTMKLL